MKRPVKFLPNATLHSTVISSPHTSSLPPLAPVGRPFVLTGVTCRHQLPIRQCNIRPILPVCDWEILEWSKPTNLIYRASINKEIVPSLIALLNNGCLFGNHFPISHHFPIDRPGRVLSFSFLLSLSLFPYFHPSSFLFCPLLHSSLYISKPHSLSLWPKVSGDSSDATVIPSLLRRRVLLWLKHFVFWFILSLFRDRNCHHSTNVRVDSICKSLCKISRLNLKINLTLQQVNFFLL